MKHFTIGEIARGKMLMGRRGKPYTDKANIIRDLRKKFGELPRGKSVHGTSYAIPKSMIDKYNMLYGGVFKNGRV